MKPDGTHQKKICPNCGKEIIVVNFNRHYKACTEGYARDKKERYNIIFTEDLCCPFCNKQAKNKNSYAQHYLRCSNNPNKIKNNLEEYINNSNSSRKGKNKYNCPAIAKQAETMKNKYANGYVHPCKGISTKHEYIYSDYNQQQINLWLEYISSINIENNYETISHNEGYKIMSKLQIKDGNTVKVLFEHNYIANILLGGNLINSNCVHHINENRADNDKINLMVFVDKNNHKRYHNSKYAKLKYNQETHLFSCFIDKSCS